MILKSGGGTEFYTHIDYPPTSVTDAHFMPFIINSHDLLHILKLKPLYFYILNNNIHEVI